MSRAGWVERLDAYQREHRWLGLPLAVVYKYTDDQGSYLAALITYYGFLSLFPLLLLLTTILGFLLQGDPHLQARIVDSALSQFPIVGDQVGNNVRAAHGSVAAVVIGVLGSLYGSIGVAQATQNALNTAWAIPRNSRPNPLKSRLRSLGLLLILGAGLLLTTGLSGLTTGARTYTDGVLAGTPLRILATVLAIVINATIFVAVFRFLTVRSVSTRQVRPGALVAAVGWQVLQILGTWVVTHELNGADRSYGIFGVVLGLLAFIFLSAALVVLCAEANVVIAERLWPRSLLTPFTDNVRLTRADRRVYTSYAAATRSKGFEEVTTTFDPEHVAEPGPAPPISTDDDLG